MMAINDKNPENYNCIFNLENSNPIDLLSKYSYLISF